MQSLSSLSGAAVEQLSRSLRIRSATSSASVSAHFSAAIPAASSLSSSKRAGSSCREISQSKRTVVTLFSSLRASQKRFIPSEAMLSFLCNCLVTHRLMPPASRDAPGIQRSPRHPR